MARHSVLSAADVFTIINASLGFLSVVFTMEGMIPHAAAMVMFAVVADGLDGVVARRFGTTWRAGDYLDIMADTISFGVAPSIMVVSVYGYPGIPFSILWLSMTLARLARFCQRKDERTWFIGFPSASAALMLSSTVVAMRVMEVMSFEMYIVLGLMAFLSFMLISEVRYQKLRGSVLYGSGLAVLLSGVVVLLGYPQAALLMAALVLLYMASPAFWRCDDG